MICPECGADRPREMHLDWCTYDQPEPDPGTDLDLNEEDE